MRGPLHKGGLVEGEGALPRSSDSWRGPLTRNLRQARANSDLSPQAGRGKAARLSLNLAPMGLVPAIVIDVQTSSDRVRLLGVIR
jgi:hypothetical protein